MISREDDRDRRTPDACRGGIDPDSVVDVLFASAYYLNCDDKQARIGRPYPPLGTLFAAALARRMGYTVRVFDAMLAASVDSFRRELTAHPARLVVIYDDSFNWQSKMCLTRMRELAAEMIRTARPRVDAVVCNGSDMSDHPAYYLGAGADAVLLGEGEATLIELLPILLGANHAGVDSVAGLALPGHDDGFRCTPARPKLVDLDALPLPAWDLIDLDRYRSYWRQRHGHFSLNLATTRGCPYPCNWCAKPIFGRQYSARSPEHVIEEMKWLETLAGPDHYWVADDIFGLVPGWIERFGELAEAADVRVPLTVQCRPDLITEATARGLRRAGCTRVWLGAESGSQTVLDAMEKGTTIDQIRRARLRLREAGIECAFFLQFGYPGETHREIEMTLDMVRDLMPDDIGISISYPLPGTPFFNRIRDQLGDKRNWVDSGDLDMLFAGEYSPAFYRVLHRRVHAEFMTRKSLARLGEVVRRPWRVRPGDVRCLARTLRHGWAWRRLLHRCDPVREPSRTRRPAPPNHAPRRPEAAVPARSNLESSSV